MNRLILYLAIFSLFIMFLFPFINLSLMNNDFQNYITYSYENESVGWNYVNNVIVYFLLLAYFLPVSLFVTLEILRMLNTI